MLNADTDFNAPTNKNQQHSKKCWVVLTQFLVKYGQTQPLGYILNSIFNPMASFFRVNVDKVLLHWVRFAVWTISYLVTPQH